MPGPPAARAIHSPGLESSVTTCPAALQQLAQDRVCVMSSDGIAVAGDMARATSLVQRAQENPGQANPA